MKNADLLAAQAFFPELARALDRMPPCNYKDPDVKAARTWAQDDIKDMIESKGGIVRIRFDGTIVRLFGLRASSTSGLEGACRNWISQLTVKAMAARNGGEA